jgi:hypothetical protein
VFSSLNLKKQLSANYFLNSADRSDLSDLSDLRYGLAGFTSPTGLPSIKLELMTACSIDMGFTRPLIRLRRPICISLRSILPRDYSQIRD